MIISNGSSPLSLRWWTRGIADEIHMIQLSNPCRCKKLTNSRAKKRIRRIPQQKMERPSRSTSGWYWLTQENLRYSASFLGSWLFSRYFPLAGMANTSYRGIAGVNKYSRGKESVSPNVILCDQARSLFLFFKKRKEVQSYRSARGALLAHDAQVKLLSFQRGILTAVASHTLVVVLSNRFLLNRSPSLSACLPPPLPSPFVFLSSVWCWQEDLLHPLPATVLLPSVSLSNKPGKCRRRGGGEGSLRKGRRGVWRKSRSRNRSWWGQQQRSEMSPPRLRI